jgi:hypothetical protein
MLRIFSILNVQGFCVWLDPVLGLLVILVKPTASITTPIIIKIWENSLLYRRILKGFGTFLSLFSKSLSFKSVKK